MRKLSFIFITVIGLGAVGCSGEEQVADDTAMKPVETKAPEGAITTSQPKLERNPNWDPSSK